MKIKGVKLINLLMCIGIVFIFASRANTQSKRFESLISDLKNHDSSIRRNAATALGRLKDARASAPLLNALEDEDHYVRKSAARALGQLKDPIAVEPLIAALRDKYYLVREEAALALGKLGDTRAIEPLILALKDKSSYVRRNTAVALGELKDRRAVVPLLDALKDESFVVGMKAACALGEVKDPRTFDPLVALLKDKSAHICIRAAVAEALYNINDARALEPLIAALRDESSYLRVSVQKILEKSEDPGIVQALAAARKEEEAEFRIWARSDKLYVFVNVPTEITIVAEIARNPNLIPESVNLYRFDNTKRVANLGRLNKDLRMGAGDYGFSTQVTLNESAPGEIRLKLTAAYKKNPVEIESDPIIIKIKVKPDPEEVISNLGADLRNGDITSALTKFVPSHKYKELLENLDSSSQRQLADWFENAQLIRDGANCKVYRSQWIDEKGACEQSEFRMCLNELGEWVITSW